MGNHFVAQRLLRNFEDPAKPGFLWLHQKRGGNPRLVPIKSVAQKRNFYDAETEDRITREVEVPGFAVIRKLINGESIKSAERSVLATYIALGRKRVPSHRRWATNFAAEKGPDILDSIIAVNRGALQEMADEGRVGHEFVARRLRELDAAHSRIASQGVLAVSDQIKNPWPSEQHVQVTFDMMWRVLRSSGPQYFIITDNPSFMFSGIGLTHEQSEFTFPLSMTHVLHGSRQGTQGGLLFADANQRLVRELNKHLVSEVDEVAFYHEPAQWLLHLLRKENLYLCSIAW